MEGRASVVADVLGVVRLLVALAFPATLARALAGGTPGLPLALFTLAAASDFFDGILARRAGRPTRHGAVLDTVADVAFVLAGTGAGAALGLVPTAVPAAIAVSVAGYALASMGTTSQGGELRLARSRVGHWGGVCNYALTGLIAGAAWLPGPAWAKILAAASLGVVGVNLAAVLERMVPARGEARGATPTAPRART
jgi:phosphatidylglycerophosphate synthase